MESKQTIKQNTESKQVIKQIYTDLFYFMHKVDTKEKDINFYLVLLEQIELLLRQTKKIP